MDVSVGSRARHLTDVDGDLWDLVRRDLQLKATFLYIDLNRLIASNECEERREEITLLANDFFYSKDEGM
jgi:photosystem II oxygen-evolving enhancer protein 3